jgi:hypothetical protein
VLKASATTPSALDYPADAVTDAMVLNMAAEQMPDGSWCLGGVSRSPTEQRGMAAGRETDTWRAMHIQQARRSMRYSSQANWRQRMRITGAA